MRVIKYRGWIAAWVHSGGIGLAPHVHQLPEDHPERRIVVRVAEHALRRRAYCSRLPAIEIPSCLETGLTAWPCRFWYLAGLPFPTLRSLYMAPAAERRPVRGRSRCASRALSGGRRRR